MMREDVIQKIKEHSHEIYLEEIFNTKVQVDINIIWEAANTDTYILVNMIEELFKVM